MKKATWFVVGEGLLRHVKPLFTCPLQEAGARSRREDRPSLYMKNVGLDQGTIWGDPNRLASPAIGDK